MDHNYDEDVLFNQFLIALCKSSAETFYKAVENGWPICVPRVGSFSKNKYSEKDFNDHILTPSKCSDLKFNTLSGHDVYVDKDNHVIKCQYDGKTNTVDILFTETCYTENDQGYKIICTDGPLTSTSMLEDIIVIKSVQDCLNFLYSKNNKLLLKDLRSLIDDFLSSNDYINMSVDVKKKAMENLYNKCLKKTNYHIKLSNNFFQNNIKLAIEYYIQNKLYNALINSINILLAKEDAKLNKLIRNCSSAMIDMEVDQEVENAIPNARCELSKLYVHKTVIGKFKCLKDTFLKLSNGNKHFTVDNLLSALVHLVIHCKIPNWNAQIYFMKHFIINNVKDFDDNFYLTSLEAAVEHIKINNFNLELSTNFHDPKCGNFYNYIRKGEYYKVKETLEFVKIQQCSSKCHPLCECDTCMKEVLKEPTVCVKYKDEQGLTPLHVAAFYGYPLIIELLLEYGSDINALDNFSRTPAHYAALRGQQNALLFLLHNKALMISDNEGNSPLHLCCSNGHDACVKALLYFMEFSDSKLNINVQNNQGDTPLHLCFKWGYSSIVQILIEQDGDPLVCNRRGQTCFDCAFNSRMVEIFSIYKKNNIERVRRSSVEITSQQKMIEKIITAISDGDIRLVQHYLNIDDENQNVNKSVNVNSYSYKGYTPLHVAVNSGKIDIVKMLIEYGADVNLVTTSEQRTALHLAVQNKLSEIVDILLDSKKCDINKQDNCGNSELHYACSVGDANIISKLLKHGADFGLINKQFISPLNILNESTELRHLISMKKKTL
ncbi:VPS9 domain,Ankyrin repeat-containing domain,Ankyrin repeat [Cinara cedri]|uniref:VPS9 domain,Ankyrin repeat-containing domain,Ankyrin repeat n=1 Tax=Cinara cedri TaxID=506608 RepID=A0A5E4MRM9_9HEMI|nr:VPS9 domain,Ankyrin repeat-containing domain,Ankyrin repeat [Cinara cedri]